MAYGTVLNGFAFTYGSLSVVAKGTVSANPEGNGTYTIIYKEDHPDITDWRVVFTPTGVRDISVDEVRPYFAETAAAIFIHRPTGVSEHQYLVLGR